MDKEEILAQRKLAFTSLVRDLEKGSYPEKLIPGLATLRFNPEEQYQLAQAIIAYFLHDPNGGRLEALAQVLMKGFMDPLTFGQAMVDFLQDKDDATKVIVQRLVERLRALADAN